MTINEQEIKNAVKLLSAIFLHADEVRSFVLSKGKEQYSAAQFDWLSDYKSTIDEMEKFGWNLRDYYRHLATDDCVENPKNSLELGFMPGWEEKVEEVMEKLAIELGAS